MRILEPYKDYFWEFYNPLNQKVKDKVDYVLQIVMKYKKYQLSSLNILKMVFMKSESNLVATSTGYLPFSMTTNW
jgi:precorrin-3B methylase